MLFATWVTALNILVFAALVAAVIYLFVLIVRALKKYICSKEMREEKQAVKRTLGETLKAHRTRCQMTQEFEAEALGVSRQTVSNWETGKTYPDIVSVIRMSGLYSVSLDCLLKEEKTVSNYLNYLEESTNVVKSRRRLGKLVLVAAYLVIWAVSVAFFWLAVSGSDAGAYAVLVIWGAIPLTTFVISLLIGANGYWGRRKWWAVPILALMYTLIPFLTFTLANAASTGVSAGDIAVNLDDLITLPIGAAVSAAGLAIGTGIEKLRERKLKRKNNILTQESTKSQE